VTTAEVSGGDGAVVPAAVDTRLAMASTWPVRTSITSATPLTAWVAEIWAARACSVAYCRGSSTVSSSPVPGTVLVRFSIGVWGSCTPRGDSSSVSLPDRPASSLLYWYSRPAAPAPDALVRPSTGTASGPLGTTRRELSTTVMPGRFS